MPDTGVFIGGLLVTCMVAAAVGLLLYGASKEPRLRPDPNATDDEGRRTLRPESLRAEGR